jgi:hypothetical protein
MNNFQRRALIVGAITLLTACAARPPEATHGNLAPGARVGVFVELSPQPRQLHKGMTVGGNFVKTYPFNWGLKEDVQKAIFEALRQRGLVAVDLDKVVGADSRSETWLPTIQKRAGVQAVVAVREVRSYTRLPTYQFADVPGVFSVRSWTSTSFTTIAPLRWNVWTFDSGPDDIAVSSGLGKRLNSDRQVTPEMWKGVEVADYEAVTAEEFQQAKNIIVRSVAQSAGQVAQRLAAN